MIFPMAIASARYFRKYESMWLLSHQALNYFGGLIIWVAAIFSMSNVWVHFNTDHTIIGLALLTLLITQFFYGLYRPFKPPEKNLSQQENKDDVKSFKYFDGSLEFRRHCWFICHRFIAMLIIILSVCAILTGLDSITSYGRVDTSRYSFSVGIWLGCICLVFLIMEKFRRKYKGQTLGYTFGTLVLQQHHVF